MPVEALQMNRPRRWRRVLPTAWVALVIGVAPGTSDGNSSDTPVVPETQLAVARTAADDLGARLRALLMAELARGGPQGAVEACAAQAQEATLEEAARHGVALRRVSLQYRNPADAPDEFERAALERLAAGARQGSLPAEVAQVTAGPDGGSELRYLRPIVLAPQCLGCHGKVAELAPGVAAILAQRYPGDLATGYAAGDLRGAVSVRVALPKDLPAAAAPKVP